MKIEEAIVYVLASSDRGMKTDMIARIINERRLHVRADGQKVTSAQVYAVIMHHSSVFTKEDGVIRLLI